MCCSVLNFLLLIGSQIKKSLLDTEAAARIVSVFFLSPCVFLLFYIQERVRACNNEDNSNAL